jgi:hypothetical protein
MSQGRNQHEAFVWYLFHAGFVLCLFFNTDDGGGKFL